MFVHTFIRGFQWPFSLYRNFKESLFNTNHFILVIKFENLKLRKSWVSQKKKKNSQYSLAVNKFPRFLSSGARTTIFNRLAFPKFQRFLDNISSFQQIVQNSSVDMLPCNTSRMLCQRQLRVFLSGNHRHTRFNSLAQGFHLSVLLLRQISW